MIKHGLALALSSAISISASAGFAKADQIEQLFQNSGAGCTDTIKVNLVDAIRNGIDTEVKRHEAALEKPPALGSMGCLDNLFKVNLDIAIQVPDLQGIFNQAVSNAESQLCSYAQDAWNKVTEPLQSALQLPQFNQLQLPSGLGSGTAPSMDFNYQGGQLNFGNPSSGDTQRRTYRSPLMQEFYNNMYGPGSSL